MTTIYQYIEALKARGIDLVVTHLGTLRVLPELVDWDERRDVLEFLGLRRQVLRALVYSEDRLIDEGERDRNLRALKLAGSTIRESRYQEALGQLDGDAAAETARRDKRRDIHQEQEAAELIGACLGEELGCEIHVPTVDRQLLARQKECARLGIDYRSVDWKD